jgi:hypothetical protein
MKVSMAVLSTLVLAGMSALPAAVTLPPPQYDHEPKVKYEIIEVPWHKVAEVCPGRGREGACAVDFGPLGWTIVMPERDGSFLADDWGRLLRHEKGHLNGWSRAHPDTYLCGDARCSWLYSVERGDERRR